MAELAADVVDATASCPAPDADLEALRRRGTARALAEGTGRHDTALDAAVALLCARLSPRRESPEQPDTGTVMAGLRDAVGALDERREVTVTDVLAAERAEPVLHTTLRRTVADLPVGAATIPVGSTVVVALGAATRGSADATWSFGAGRHACPGRDLALAITAGVLTALGRPGARVAPPVAYEPRPNLRVPVFRSAKLAPGRASTGGSSR